MGLLFWLSIKMRGFKDLLYCIHSIKKLVVIFTCWCIHSKKYHKSYMPYIVTNTSYLNSCLLSVVTCNTYHAQSYEKQGAYTITCCVLAYWFIWRRKFQLSKKESPYIGFIGWKVEGDTHHFLWFTITMTTWEKFLNNKVLLQEMANDGVDFSI